MDDLKELLDRRASRIEPPPDGIERLLARAARRRRNRRLGSAVLVVVLLAGVGATLWALAPLGEKGVAPGGSNRSTYELSDFRIEYPFGPRATVGPEVAGVSLVVSWRDGVYPGEVVCRLVLKGAAGEVVGTLATTVDSATDGARVRPSGFVVPVSDTPVSAEGSCEEGIAPTGEGFVLTVVDVSRPWNSASQQPYPDRTKLTVEVTQNTTGDRGIRTCHLRIFRIDGSVDGSPFSTNLSVPGSRTSLNVPGKPSTVRDVRIDCGPLEPGG